MKSNMDTREELLKNVQKIVVKVGTSTLTNEDGKLNIDKVKKKYFLPFHASFFLFCLN